MIPNRVLDLASGIMTACTLPPRLRTEDWYFPGSPSSTLPLAPATVVALVDFNFSIEEGGIFGLTVGDNLAELMVIEDRGVAVHAR